MFGYITVNKQELKFKEFDVYHSYYCGLCRCLRKHYGVWGQMTLSFDMTFAAVLLSSLYEPQTKLEKCYCLAHPFEKQVMCSNEVIDYLSDMNMFLTIYKCEDDWKDDRNFFKKWYGEILSSKCDKKRDKYFYKEDFVTSRLRKIADIEAAGSDDIDSIAGLFGEIMGEILCYRQDEWSENIRNVGYHLGRFIYILDAYDDIDKDIEKGNYNPLKSRRMDEDFDENIHTVLTMIMADCCREFEILPIVDNLEILRNILYSGVWSRFEAVREARTKGKK